MSSLLSHSSSGSDSDGGGAHCLQSHFVILTKFRFTFQNRSTSMIDIMYIDNSEPSENVGQIHFCVEYDFQNNTLILKILQVRWVLESALVNAWNHRTEKKHTTQSYYHYWNGNWTSFTRTPIENGTIIHAELLSSTIAINRNRNIRTFREMYQTVCQIFIIRIDWYRM